MNRKCGEKWKWIFLNQFCSKNEIKMHEWKRYAIHSHFDLTYSSKEMKKKKKYFQQKHLILTTDGIQY